VRRGWGGWRQERVKIEEVSEKERGKKEGVNMGRRWCKIFFISVLLKQKCMVRAEKSLFNSSNF
jgi:hypothetical protein